MPRKPSSLFVLVEPAISQLGQNPTPAQAYRFRLDENTTAEQILEAEYLKHPAGSRVYVVDDTKVTAYTIGVRLDEVDDPRLVEEEVTPGG